MFDFDKSKFMPNGCGLFPPENPPAPRPSFTLTEEMHSTITQMHNTIDRLLKFEERVKNEVHDLMSRLTSDNVLFKDTFNQAHTLFLQEVKNEVNLFESNVDNTVKLFMDNVKTDYENLDTKTQTLIDESFNTLKTNLEALIESNSTANAEANADFYRRIETELNTFEADVNNKVAMVTNSMSENWETFKTNMTETITQRLDAQDARLANAENYMKINLEASVRTELGDMVDSGELEGILQTELIDNLNTKVQELETELNTIKIETIPDYEARITALEASLSAGAITMNFDGETVTAESGDLQEV